MLFLKYYRSVISEKSLWIRIIAHVDLYIYSLLQWICGYNFTMNNFTITILQELLQWICGICGYRSCKLGGTASDETWCQSGSGNISL